MPDPETPKLGPIATAVLFEDDEIRIWDKQLAPGEVLPAHRHDHDYWLLDVSGEHISVDFLPGNQGSTTATSIWRLRAAAACSSVSNWWPTARPRNLTIQT